MKSKTVKTLVLAAMVMLPGSASAQYRDKAAEETPKTEADLILEQAENAQEPVVITLEQALPLKTVQK